MKGEVENSLDKLFNEIPIDEKFLNQMLEFLGNFDFHVKIVKKGKRRYLRVPPNKDKIEFIGSFMQWLEFQWSFYTDESSIGLSLRNLIEEKISKFQKKYPSYNSFPNIMDLNRHNFFPENKEKLNLTFLERLEKCLRERKCLIVKMEEDSILEIYFHRILFLEGVLCLVGEDVSEKCLIYFPVEDCTEIIKETNRNYNPNFSPIEINDFIYAIRNMGGRTERIIFKIKDKDKFDFLNSYHFLSNPFCTLNNNSDLICGATVEVSNEFFWWLSKYQEILEIIDPSSIIGEFNEFLNDIQKNSLKKAV